MVQALGFCAFVKVSVCPSLCRWSIFFFCEGEGSFKESRDSGHILTISLLQSSSRSCHPIHVAVSLLWFSCLMFPFCLQHDTFPSVSLALSLHVLGYFSPQPQKKSTFSWSEYCVLFPLPVCVRLLMRRAVYSVLFTGCCSVIPCSRSVDLCFVTMCAQGTNR